MWGPIKDSHFQNYQHVPRSSRIVYPLEWVNFVRKQYQNWLIKELGIYNKIQKLTQELDGNF